MTEQELTKKIHLLKEIKPREDWVALVKKEILNNQHRELVREELTVGEQILSVFHLLFNKPAFTLAVCLGILISFGAFGFAQNSLPGDALFSVKKMAEEGRTVFVSAEQKPRVQLELANKRLEELNSIAENNQAKNLAPALNEFQVNIAQAVKEIAKAEEINVKEIVRETKKLKENKQKIEALGVVVGETEGLDNALSQIVEREIEDLENRSLSEEQQEIFDEIKEDFIAGDYNQALENILLLSYPQL